MRSGGGGAVWCVGETFRVTDPPRENPPISLNRRCRNPREHATTTSSAPSDAHGEADSPQEDGTTEDDRANESDDQQHLGRGRSTRHEQSP